MTAFRTRNSKDIKIRLDALKNGNDFAFQTFLALRKDDSCWRRLLRFLYIIKPMDI